MSVASKSPKGVLRVAYQTGCRSLEDYSHPSSPHTYTQPQLFACLVLKVFLGMDYRGIYRFLDDFSEARKLIGLCRAPHFTTLQKACHRLLRQEQVARLLEQTINEHERIKKKEALLKA